MSRMVGCNVAMRNAEKVERKLDFGEDCEDNDDGWNFR